MYNQSVINPAYSGVRNSFSVVGTSRQQWMGIKGAPVNYALGINSPFNNSMASVGMNLSHYQAGPVSNSRLMLSYAYLVRISGGLFMSLGLNGTANYYQVGFGDVSLVDPEDPNFMGELASAFTPNFGAGVFIYSPSFFIGFSAPQVLELNYKRTSNDGVVAKIPRHYYFTSGLTIGGGDVYLKPSVLGRFLATGESSWDINAQIYFKEFLSLGGSYRLGDSFAAIAGFGIGKITKIYYSYDFPVSGEASIGKGSHELSLVFDFDILERNRDREFSRRRKKAKTADPNAGVKTIR